MKICLVTNLYPPYTVGGAGVVVADTAKRLQAAGHDVVVITALPHKPEKNTVHQTKDLEDGIVVYRYWVPNVCSYSELKNKRFLFRLFWHMIDSFNVRSAKIILSILKEEKPDMVHTHNMMGIGLYALSCIAPSGFFHIHTVHDVQLVEPSGVLPATHTRDTLLQRVYSIFTRFMSKNISLVVSPSKYLARFYKKRGFFQKSDWYILNEHIDVIQEVPRISGRKVDATFMFVGSLTDHKGISILLDAWRRLSTRSNATLHIVGDGPYRKEVERVRYGDKRIVVHGHVQGDTLFQLYKQADVLLFTSTCIENRPNVIVEALHAGMIVIAADTGGVGELVVDGVNGYMVTPNSAVALAQRMRQVLFQDKQIPAMSHRTMTKLPYIHAQTGVYNYAEVLMRKQRVIKNQRTYS